MEFRLRPLDFIDFFAKQQSSGSSENENKVQEIRYKKKDWLIIVVLQKIHETQWSQSKFHELYIYIYIYIYMIYIYLLLFIIY